MRKIFCDKIMPGDFMKIYYKTKILVNGIFPLVNFSIDDFKQKTDIYNETKIDTNDKEYIFYASGYLLLGAYSCKEKEGVYYEYFENDELLELEIENETSIDNIQTIVLDNEIKKISLLQKKLRLLSGYGISMPIFLTTIYDSNKNFLTYTGHTKHEATNLTVRDYTDEMKEKLVDRLKFRISDKAITELESKNIRFKRALSFYNDSFNHSSNSTKFILLISSLETLFNLSGKKIKNTLSKYTSKILFLSKKESNNIHKIINKYYIIRSNYIHGNSAYIKKDDVEKLTQIVRETLLIYWNISLVYNKYEASIIKKIIEKNTVDTLDIQTQLFIKYLRTKPENFEELYKRIKSNFLNKDYSILNNQSLNITEVKN